MSDRSSAMLRIALYCFALSVSVGCAHGGQESAVIQGDEGKAEKAEGQASSPQTMNAKAGAIFAGKDDSSMANPMTHQKAAAILRGIAGELEQLSDHAYSFSLSGVGMAIVMDPAADRMRIIAPIADASEYKAETLMVLMEANFHTALDARYAISDGTVYAAYMHPLSSLDQLTLESAAMQVSNLVQTYGTSFSSLDIVFPKRETQENE